MKEFSVYFFTRQSQIGNGFCVDLVGLLAVRFTLVYLGLGSGIDYPAWFRPQKGVPCFLLIGNITLCDINPDHLPGMV